MEQGIVGGFKDGLLDSLGHGSCFAVSSTKQKNVCVAVARGLQLPNSSSAAQALLRQAAVQTAAAAGYCFPTGSRACRELEVF
jgi:hypothetical protein